MVLSSRALWSSDVRSPLTRLLIALFIAPLIMSALLTVAAFLIAGMSEPTQADVMSVTHEAAVAALMLNYVFTLTFGLAGILGLWFLEQRGSIVWAIAGALMGALASVVFGTFFMDGVERVLLLAFALAGWALFVLIRWIAGVRKYIDQ